MTEPTPDGTPEPTPERIPDLVVERLALDELPADEANALRERLTAAGDDRLDAIARSNAEILREHPPQQVAASVARRLERLEQDERPRSPAGWMTWAPVAAAAGLALVWWVGRDEDETVDDGIIARVEPSPAADSGAHVPPVGPGADDQGPETIVLKGDPQLVVDRLENLRPVTMRDQDPAAAGDHLQVSYRAAGFAQGAIVSIDGAGVTTLHFPATEDASPRLDQGGRIPLASSYELDDAPGFERFFFVTVAQDQPPLDVARVLDAARSLAADDGLEGELSLPEAWRQQSLVLRKAPSTPK